MIFVTLGSQKFQFDRLLKKLDELVEDGVIREEITAQIGASTYLPKHFPYVRFMDREEFAEVTSRCDIVITHGGTGVIIALPRLAKYGEHVDDHQLQLLRQFDDLGIICACYDMEKLGEIYRNLDGMTFRPYVSNTHVIIQSIEEYLEALPEKRRGKRR